MGEQPAPAGRADAGDFVQHRGHADFVALVAVGRDGKAMGFIADALHQKQALRMARQHNGVVMTGQEQFFLLFGQSHYRHLAEQVEFLQHLHRPAQLPFAAVHDQQIGQQRKGRIQLLARLQFGFLGYLPALEAPREGLFHAGKIIGAIGALDVETPVQFFAGRALLKNHHTGHRGGALGV